MFESYNVFVLLLLYQIDNFIKIKLINLNFNFNFIVV